MNVVPCSVADLHCGKAVAQGVSLRRSVTIDYHRHMQRLLIVLGLAIAAVGLLWPWLSKLPFGRLPGDIMIDRPGFKFFAPFTTMIVLSLVVSLVLWLFRR